MTIIRLSVCDHEYLTIDVTISLVIYVIFFVILFFYLNVNN